MSSTGGLYSAARMEAAAQRALLTGACRYQSIRSILKDSLDRQPLPEQNPTPKLKLPLVQHRRNPSDDARDRQQTLGMARQRPGDVSLVWIASGWTANHSRRVIRLRSPQCESPVSQEMSCSSDCPEGAPPVRSLLHKQEKSVNSVDSHARADDLAAVVDSRGLTHCAARKRAEVSHHSVLP